MDGGDVQFATLLGRRPIVVVDMNYLRGLPAGAGIPGTFTALLPDALFVEAATSTKPAALIGKYESILTHPLTRGRVLLGRYPDELIHEERHPRQIRSGSSAVINIPYSRSILDLRSGDLNVPDIDFGSTHFGRSKAEFLDLSSRFVKWQAEHDPEPMPRFASDKQALDWIAKTITNGSQHRLLANLWPSRFRSRAWEREHVRFPDRGAMARWFRVQAWYYFRRATKPSVGDRSFGNSFEDMYYVFSSLYTRHLLTSDGDLAEAARAVSGGAVTVYTSHEQVAAY